MRRRALGLAVAGLLMVGCAGVPTSGPVHLGSSLPSLAGADDRDIRVFPPKPIAGLTRTEVVTQYLDAMVGNNDNYGVARLYVASGSSWNASSRITIYNQDSLVVRSVSKHVVDATFDQVGTVDDRGSYRVQPETRTISYRLGRDRGQWRISHPPAGALLSSSDARQALERANLYFFNLAQNRLVAAPILVPPNQPGLATILIQRLLAGPEPGLAPAVQTAAPSTLARIGNVPVDSNGIAEVNLSGGFQQVSTVELQRLSAQIVWTLRQVPSVTGVRLLDNGAPLTDVGVPRVQSVDLWQEFDPDGPPVSPGALFTKNGVVAGLQRPAPKALTRPSLSAPVASVSASAGGGQVAALRTGRRAMTLVVGPAGGPFRARLSAPVLASPAFDPAGDVYVVVGTGGAASVVEVPPSGPTRPVSVPFGVEQRGITALSVSRDGARVALVVGPPGRSALLVAALSAEHGHLRITNAAPVLGSDRDVQGVAWANADQVVATVDRGGGRRSVVRASIDGYRPHLVRAAGLPSRPTQVAASPAQPLLAMAAGQLWSLSDHFWTRVSTGRDPSYAG